MSETNFEALKKTAIENKHILDRIEEIHQSHTPIPIKKLENVLKAQSYYYNQMKFKILY